jgi:peroxiredoxin
MDPTPLAVGDAAPDLTFASSTGAPIRLGEYRGAGNLVLFFMRAFT